MTTHASTTIHPLALAQASPSMLNQMLQSAISKNMSHLSQQAAQQQANQLQNALAGQQVQQQLANAYYSQQAGLNVTTSSPVTLGSLMVTTLGTGSSAVTTAASSGTYTSAATNAHAHTGLTGGAHTHSLGIVTNPNDLLALGFADEATIVEGHPCKIKFPDGTILDVLADGSFKIIDNKAKVTYRANRMRDFNSFINASDKVEAFIEFCGEHGVRADEMLDLPIKLFLGWIIVQAAKADQEPPPADIRLIPDLRKVAAPRCPGCGRFTLHAMRAKKLEFCAPPCFERHYNRTLPELPCAA